jgi:hypothetical protein
MIDSWSYLLKHNPSATYEIGVPQDFNGNLMIRCEITISSCSRYCYAAVEGNYPTASDIEASQNYALIKCIAMFSTDLKVDKELHNPIPF